LGYSGAKRQGEEIEMMERKMHDGNKRNW